MSFSMVVQSAARSRILYMAHKFSVGFRKVEFLGQSKICYVPYHENCDQFSCVSGTKILRKDPRTIRIPLCQRSKRSSYSFHWLKASDIIVTKGSPKHLCLQFLTIRLIQQGILETSLYVIFDCAECWSNPWYQLSKLLDVDSSKCAVTNFAIYSIFCNESAFTLNSFISRKINYGRLLLRRFSEQNEHGVSRWQTKRPSQFDLKPFILLCEKKFLKLNKICRPT